MNKILIFGVTGMLGSSLYPYLLRKGYEVFTAGRSESSDLIFSSSKTINELHRDLINIEPKVIINLIAATNVDQCEQFPEIANELNSEIIKNVTLATRGYKIFAPHIIHISSDQVYSGTGPHFESEPKPCNTYGISKLAGEKWVLEAGGTVLRTNFVGASQKAGRDSFTDWLYKNIQSQVSTPVIEDCLFSPGHIDDVCEAVELVINNPQGGIYNYGARSAISKSEFGFAFINGLEMNSCLLKKSCLSNLSLLAKRPNDMSMNVTLFEKTFKKKCPEIFDVIKKCISDYQNE